MTDLDKKLQELAVSDWEQFIEVIGPDGIFTAKARILRQNGKSWQQISMKLEATPAKVRTACKNKAVKKQQV